MSSEVITSMDDYIEAKQRWDKLKAYEHVVELADGPQVGVSSYLKEYVGPTLQALIDDLILEHGISGARKIINRELEAAIREYQK